jgi:hypothetical protein
MSPPPPSAPLGATTCVDKLGSLPPSRSRPLVVGLTHPEHHREQHPLAGLGESPGDQDVLLGPSGGTLLPNAIAVVPALRFSLMDASAPRRACPPQGTIPERGASRVLAPASAGEGRSGPALRPAQAG